MVGVSHPAAQWGAIFLCASGLFVAWVLARTEWKRYQDPRPEEQHFATSARLGRRLLGSAVLALVMLLLLAGTQIIDFRDRPILLLCYWGIFCFLIICLVTIALADILDTHRILHREQSRALRDALKKVQATGGSDTGGPVEPKD